MLISKLLKIVFIGYDNNEIFIPTDVRAKSIIEYYKSTHYLLNKVEQKEHFDFVFVNYDSIYESDIDFLFAIKRNLSNLQIIIEYSTIFAYAKIENIVNNGIYSIVRKNGLNSYWKYIEILQDSNFVILCPSIMNAYFKHKQNHYIRAESQNFISISDLEFTILMHLSQGKSYEEIAKNLNFGLNTLRYHIKKIYKKLNVHNRSSAIELYFKDILSVS